MTARLPATDRTSLLATGGLLAGLPPEVVLICLTIMWVVLPAILIAIALPSATHPQRIDLMRRYLRLLRQSPVP